MSCELSLNADAEVGRSVALKVESECSERFCDEAAI
jgi:hypothetical protein